MKKSLILSLVLGLSALHAAPDYEKLAAGPWQVRSWGGKPFSFIGHGGFLAERNYIEYEHFNLLTPTWKDPDYQPKRAGVAEWGWTLRPDGGNKRQAYEWTRNWYLGKKKERQKPGDKWVCFTGHEWFSAYGAAWGADLLVHESGENIIAMQGQLALMRGSARLHGIPFGLQPSQWYSSGGMTAWVIGYDEYTRPGPEVPPAKTIWSNGNVYNGGHSPSLLSRMWYDAWLSGAAFVSPEGSDFFARDVSGKTKYVPGGMNVPLDPTVRASLSPMGERARKFMEVTTRHTNVGVPYAPFLIMLDHFAGFNGYHYSAPSPWNVLEPSEGDWEISRMLDTIFPGSMHLELVAGVNDDWYNPVDEHRRLVNAPWGDSFDMILAPAPQGRLGQEHIPADDPLYRKLDYYHQLLEQYPVLFLAGDQTFPFETLQVLARYLHQGGHLFMTEQQKARLGPKFDVLASAATMPAFSLDDPTRKRAGAGGPNKNGGKLEIYSLAKLPALLDELKTRHQPVEVTGSIQYKLNRTAEGWVVGLINNDGITKAPCDPVVIDRSKTSTVRLRLRSGSIEAAREWMTDSALKAEAGMVTVKVEPGEIRIVEIKD